MPANCEAASSERQTNDIELSDQKNDCDAGYSIDDSLDVGIADCRLTSKDSPTLPNNMRLSFIYWEPNWVGPLAR